MPKYEVKRLFVDQHTKDVYHEGTTIELTAERAEEVKSTLGDTFIKEVKTKKAKGAK